MASGDHFRNGEQVEVRTYGSPSRDAVVIDKTRGDATVVKYPDGTTSLIANKAITRKD